jgi:hypothetical protein
MYAAGTLPLVIQLYNFLIFLRLAWFCLSTEK